MSGSWSNNATTSLTLPTGAVPPQQRITLDGSTDTILVYSATGALIASVAATAGNDGLGNSYPAGISSTGGVISQSVILLYNGTPALGNLVASMAATAGTDSFGNGYIAGVGAYDPVIDLTYTALQAGQILLGTINNHIPDTADAGLIAPSISGVTNSMGLESPTNVAELQPALLQLISGNGSAGTGQPGVPRAQLSDTTGVQPMDIDISGTVIKTSLSSFLETWNTPGAAANWSIGTLQFRLDPLDNLVVVGSLSYTGAAVATAGSSVATTAAAAKFRPAHQWKVPLVHYTSTSVQKNVAASLLVNTDGTYTVQWGDGVAGTTHDVNGLATGDIFWADATVPLGHIS